jgi:ABC-type nitrate/sulfonate/bicarbonate transport system ATPase subunit
MLKRVELARALVVKPEILYMDEPFSALDALMNLRMRAMLQRILGEERHTVLLITHDVEEAIHLADHIIVLSPRPATIQKTFHVSLPHPRKISSPEAQGLREAVLKELEVIETYLDHLSDFETATENTAATEGAQRRSPARYEEGSQTK